jgi:hypothetical protein
MAQTQFFHGDQHSLIFQANKTLAGVFNGHGETPSHALSTISVNTNLVEPHLVINHLRDLVIGSTKRRCTGKKRKS